MSNQLAQKPLCTVTKEIYGLSTLPTCVATYNPKTYVTSIFTKNATSYLPTSLNS